MNRIRMAVQRSPLQALLALVALLVLPLAAMGDIPTVTRTATFSTSSASPLTMTCAAGQSSVSVQTTGTFSQTLQPEQSNDGNTWSNLGSAITAAGNTNYVLGGFLYFRIAQTAYTSGSASVVASCNASVASISQVLGTAPISVSSPSAGQQTVSCPSCGSTTITASAPIVYNGGNIACSTCAVTNANNNFSVGQTVNGNVTASGGSFVTGSSAYGPTSAAVNGTLAIAGAFSGATSSDASAFVTTDIIRPHTFGGNVVLQNSGGTTILTANGVSGNTVSNYSFTAGSSTYGPTGAVVNGHLTYVTPAATCSASSNLPCTFTWTCTMALGACTTTQAVPALSNCTTTPTVNPVLSTTNIASDWVTLASTTLTVHVADTLGTSTAAFSGNGHCL